MAHVLILEDDPVSRRFLRDVLEKVLKHTVAEASSVKEALFAAREARFDLMFLDQHLPDGTAVDFCHTLSQLQSHTETPKWIVTGEKPVGEALQVWERLRIGGCLVKPFRIDDILEVSGRCLTALKP
jgi:CheY-like chemotaxis protein